MKTSRVKQRFKVGRHWIGDDDPVYFIADISANHDGSLRRAKRLIRLAAQAGADAAKFQNFRAAKIVSRHGFESMGRQLSHQAKWKKPVYQVYQEAALPWKWTRELKEECARAGIDYFSTPYDLEAVEMLDPQVKIFKVGSGDITWPEMLKYVAAKGKPVILATGASTIDDVRRAVNTIKPLNKRIVLMQCNTNYTAHADNFRHIHLRALGTYKKEFPFAVLGLSDHTLGHATVLGAVALGAKVIEKHFTDDNSRQGPDHPFSMNPAAWREMVARTRELESALGQEKKFVAANEQDTVVVQRRCLRAAKDLKAGALITREMVDVLRPAPKDALAPYELDKIIGMRLKADLPAGGHFTRRVLKRT